MTFRVNTRIGHLDREPLCIHGRVEGYCSVCPEMRQQFNSAMTLAEGIARRVEKYGDRLTRETRDLALLPIELVRPTGVDSWVVRVPGVEREFVITGEERALAAGTQSAETSETSAPSEGCQSGPKGNAQ
jgi:hypothetical protein